MLPRSEGVCLNFNKDNKNQFQHFNVDDPILKSVLGDIFSKYDLDGNEFLTLDDLNKMFKKIGHEFNETKIKNLFSEKKGYDTFTLKEFILIFE